MHSGKKDAVELVLIFRVLFETRASQRKASKSNFRHKSIGIGVQGLADPYIQLGRAFESPDEATDVCEP